jgi:hypothetical protein
LLKRLQVLWLHADRDFTGSLPKRPIMLNA